MRSLATMRIRSPISYISRTLPLAMRGRSATVGMRPEASSGSGGFRGRAGRPIPAHPRVVELSSKRGISRARGDTEAMELRLSELVGALSHALDVTHGQPAGHAARSCVIGMRIARAVGLDADTQSSLFYALLLKDAGC